MFDSFISKVGMKALALVTVMLLVSAVTFLTVTRVRGFGMMDENETAASQNNSPEATFTQNQLKCLNLDDGWWSPIVGPVVVKACGPAATNISSPQTTKTQTSPPSSNSQSPTSNTESSTTSTPQTQTETSTLPPNVTETKDKEGNTVLSSTVQATTFTVVVPKDSSEERKYTNTGLAEGVQKGTEQGILLAEEQQKKDYNKGLVYGIRLAFQAGDANALKEKPLTQEQLQKQISAHIYAIFSKNNSDDFKTGFLRGLTLGSDFVGLTGVSGLKHKR